MKRARDIIRSFDFYGNSIKFSVKEKESYKTISGGIFSIITYIIFLIFICVNLKNYIMREKPDVFYTEVYSDEIKITGEDYLFSIILSYKDPNKKIPFEFEKLFDLELNYITDYEKVNKTFKFIDCKKSKFNSDYFFDGTFCPDIPDEEKFLINQANFFELKVKFTNASLEDYLKILGNNLDDEKQTSFLIYAHKNIFELNNYRNPIEKSIVYHSIKNSKNLRKHLQFILKKTIIDTEIFDIFSLYKKTETFDVNKIINDFVFKEAIIPGESFLTAEFYMEDFHSIYKRKYIGLIEIFIESAVLYILIKTLIRFFYIYYWNYKYKCFLFNNLTVKDKGANNKEYICDDVDLPRNLIVEEEICKNFYERNSLEKNLKLGIKKESKYVMMNKNKNDLQKRENMESSNLNFNSLSNLNRETFKNNEIESIKPNSKISNLPLPSRFPDKDNNDNKSKFSIEMEIREARKKEIEDRKNKLESKDIFESGEEKIEKEEEGEELYLKRNYILIGNQIKTNPTIIINNTNIDHAYKRLTSKDDKTKYSFCSYLFNRKKKGNSYNAIYEFSKIFNKKFDVFFYFEKMKDIDLIKKFLFDKSQLKLIELISKKHPFTLNTVDKNAMNFKVDRLITNEELKEIISSIDFMDKLNKNILDEMFQFTEHLRK
jgi:hypothetical protein